MASPEFISLIDIAERHGRHPKAIHKLVKRLGIAVEKMVGVGTKGQKASHICTRDYERHKGRFAKDRSEFRSGKARRTPDVDSATNQGRFYLMVTEPTLEPNRFKVGYSTNVEERLRKHKTSAPHTKLIKEWPCREHWEKTAIDCVTVGTKQLGREVFLAKDLQVVVKLADGFFELMPPP